MPRVVGETRTADGDRFARCIAIGTNGSADLRLGEQLAGKRALITGGHSGIGRAVAVLFAREGADVVIDYLGEEQRDAEVTRRAVEAEGRRWGARATQLTQGGETIGG